MAWRQAALAGKFDEEFDDAGVRSAIVATKWPGFVKHLAFKRK